jgi:Xaa-Pro dipeptidase
MYSQGLETYRVPMSLYAENRQRVVAALLSRLANGSSGIILMQGGSQETRHDTDHEPVFRQESYFHYLFGTNLADCYGALSLDGKATLFIPTYGEEVATVCGENPDFEELKVELGVDDVRSVDELRGWVEEELGRMGWKKSEQNGVKVNGISNGASDLSQLKLYVLKGLNSDSGNYAVPAHFDGMEVLKEVVDESTLFPCIAECRVHKASSSNIMSHLHLCIAVILILFVFYLA